MISTKQKAFIPEPSRIWEATGALFNQQYSYLHIREINIETNDDDTHVEIVENTSVVTTATREGPIQILSRYSTLNLS